MKVHELHSWPTSPEEAEAIQYRLRPLLILDAPGPSTPRTVAGLNVSYAPTSVAAAAVVLDTKTLEIIDKSVKIGTPTFPYIPSLFAFRELPTLLEGTTTIGRVLRTQNNVKPVFVSVGHRTNLDTACRNVLDLAPEYRLPETTRRADRLSRDALAG
ncbi:hypothetical protein GCM10022254_20720 [Actinomadura meridiana]|uniref:Endonuclease V n=1 Tax=Actinomadura meridiana TaxID=559626 RepID=A0ABP8BWY3_9ACTN